MTLTESDGFLPVSGLLHEAGRAALGMYVMFPVAPVERLGRAGRHFVTAFRATQPEGVVQSGTYIPEAAQAAETLLQESTAMVTYVGRSAVGASLPLERRVLLPRGWCWMSPDSAKDDGYLVPADFACIRPEPKVRGHYSTRSHEGSLALIDPPDDAAGEN